MDAATRVWCVRPAVRRPPYHSAPLRAGQYYADLASVRRADRSWLHVAISFDLDTNIAQKRDVVTISSAPDPGER